MKHGLEPILERLEAALTPADMQVAIEALRDAFGVNHMVYHWVSAAGEQYGCGTYSPAWVARYLEREYLRIDPVLIGCLQTFQPVDWKRMDWSGKAQRAFQADAIAHGVGRQGYSIPIRGPNGQFALFTINHDADDATWAAFEQRHGPDLILIAHYFNSKALEFEPGRTPPPAQALSPREVDALTLLALGHSRAQAANALSISEHTLRAYIESARLKLGAANTTHAVARAISRGLIIV
jgi:DNA-binding CsgD family transcriptional regulator